MIEIPLGYCGCGCGGKTNIAKRNHTEQGHVKGQPYRFIRGHHKRMGPGPVGKMDQRERNRRYHERHSDAAYASTRRWIEANRFKSRAHKAVWYALKSGKLNREPCEICGVSDVHAHHDDYARPLDVRWLCALHHRAEHG